MRSEENPPELSVIIPTLNEAENLPKLLADLAAQQAVAIEVVVSDGGSSDGTVLVAAREVASLGLAGEVLAGPAGRGRQLNRGAARARARWLLFLHADSRLSDPLALTNALTALRGAGDPRLAGHFALTFDPAGAQRDFDYYLAEVRARTGLPGTIHGDQGFLLTREFFLELGGFREDLPVLEDLLLAEAVRSRGEWRLLPATVVTSPRRFRSEGMVARRTLNALLVNFAMIGWAAPLQRLPAAYRSQDRTRPLDPAWYFRELDGLLAGLPWRERGSIWYRTGAFVRANAWQLRLRRAAVHAFAAGLPPEAVPLGPVLHFRRRWDILTAHPPGHLLAALLTWLWYHGRNRHPTRGG